MKSLKKLVLANKIVNRILNTVSYSAFFIYSAVIATMIFRKEFFEINKVEITIFLGIASAILLTLFLTGCFLQKKISRMIFNKKYIL